MKCNRTVLKQRLVFFFFLLPDGFQCFLESLKLEDFNIQTLSSSKAARQSKSRSKNKIVSLCYFRLLQKAKTKSFYVFFVVVTIEYGVLNAANTFAKKINFFFCCCWCCSSILFIMLLNY
jgi:hypothetical protein